MPRSPSPRATAARPSRDNRRHIRGAALPVTGDPRTSLHLGRSRSPTSLPGEALVAVMASAINYNTVWTSIFEPVPTFGFLERYGRLAPCQAP